MADINFELKELQTSARTYQKALLNIPVMALQELLVHMHPLANVRGEKIISWLKNNLQLGPYRKRVNEDGIEITGRSIKTYLGSVEQEFDPNEAGESIYASKTILGEEVKNFQFLYGTIKSNAKLANSQGSITFNSYMVRLKDLRLGQ